MVHIYLNNMIIYIQNMLIKKFCVKLIPESRKKYTTIYVIKIWRWWHICWLCLLKLKYATKNSLYEYIIVTHRKIRVQLLFNRIKLSAHVFIFSTKFRCDEKLKPHATLTPVCGFTKYITNEITQQLASSFINSIQTQLLRASSLCQCAAATPLLHASFSNKFVAMRIICRRSVRQELSACLGQSTLFFCLSKVY